MKLLPYLVSEQWRRQYDGGKWENDWENGKTHLDTLLFRGHQTRVQRSGTSYF